MPENIQLEQPSEQPPKARGFSTWRETADLVSKIGVTIIGVAYVSGLLILNIHVRSYGINYLGFLQIEYVMVGLLWAFLVALVYCAIAFVLHQVMNFRSELKEKKLAEVILWNLIVLTGTALTPLMVLSILAEDRFVNPKGHWGAFVVLVFNAAGLNALFTMARNAAKPASLSRVKKWHLAFYILYYLFLIAGPLASYARYVFPRLSPAFGGGKVQKVNLVIRPDQLDAAKAVGLSLSDRQAGPVEVIFEASEFFLIRPPQGSDPKVKAIRLRKDLIDAAFYLTE